MEVMDYEEKASEGAADTEKSLWLSQGKHNESRPR